VGFLCRTIIRRYRVNNGETLAFNVDINEEIKLGANAVSILALVKYDELTGDTQYRTLMQELAQGIACMQDQQSGQFVHVLNAQDLTVKDPFRIVYYDGEAAFGLMRLYGLTRDERWIQVVERAFEYFIGAEHWRHHDHWLSYCVNELTLYKPEERYFRFGVQNIANYLDFILDRETTYPTLLELSMAFHAMLQRIRDDHPDMLHVLEGLDVDKFYRALHHRANYLLNGFFWPELAMYFSKPDTVVGSFFIRHHAFRVRIDDVEHYLSGYVAYWKLLKRSVHAEEYKKQASPEAKAVLLSTAPQHRTRGGVDCSTIGLLMYPFSPEGFLQVETYAAKAFERGIKVIYFSYRNLSIESGRLAGHLFERGQWLPGFYPLPPVIDNAPPRNNYERAFFERLNARVFMTCNQLGGKDVTLPLLSENDRSRHYTIPSIGLSQASIRDFLDQYGAVIVKPFRSNRGRNVFLLRRCEDGEVEVVTSGGERLLNGAEFSEFVHIRSESAWFVQRYIPSVDSQGDKTAGRVEA
jgi:hypothetical protein